MANQADTDQAAAAACRTVAVVLALGCIGLNIAAMVLAGEGDPRAPYLTLAGVSLIPLSLILSAVARAKKKGTSAAASATIGVGEQRPIDYHIDVSYSEKNEGYVAEIPDLPGCSAFGATPAEALEQVQQAKAAWLEAAREVGKPIPAPRYRPAKGPDQPNHRITD